ncbi:MAG: HAMP domain-containing histidine kinase [Actinobacteria bacterium]|nr:HAMP domain-containing histidine kinase [Actinomycetota bacterium]
MSIKFKISLWFSSMLLVILCFFSFIIYFIMSEVLYTDAENQLKTDAIHSSSMIEAEGEERYFNDPFKLLVPNAYLILYDAKGNSSSLGDVARQIVKIPLAANNIRKVRIDGNLWILYDEPIKAGEEIVGWVRVSRSMMPIIENLNKFKLILFISIPVYIIISILGGQSLAKRALHPIDSITRTARAIGQGNINQRLKLPKVKDEVGRLAETFDEMLDKIEAAFKKERQFTTDASHELRTPITIISAHAEDALGTDNKKDYKEALEIIYKESQKMSVMISQLLLLSRSDEGKYHLEIEDIDLKLIMDEIIGEMKESTKANNIKLYFSGEDGLVIKADQTLITRLFINIINNAIKFSKKGGFVKVQIAADSDKNFAKILIEDNGIGIPKEDIENIFNRFYQVDKSRNDKGTGLGLAIAKWIVDIHKGTINIESELGKGTKFYINLPLKKK